MTSFEATAFWALLAMGALAFGRLMIWATQPMLPRKDLLAEHYR